MIDYEILMEMTRKENSDKILMQKMKEEKLKNELLMKQKFQEDLKKKREMEKEIMIKKEFEENERKKHEQFLQDQKKIQSEIEKEKQKKMEKIKKDLFEKRKLEEFKIHTEKNIFCNQAKIVDRQKIMIEREEIRKKNMGSKKEEMLKFNQQIQEVHEKKLLITRMNLENNIIHQKEVH